MSTKKPSWWRRRLRAAGRERGMVEAGIAAAGGLLVVGAVVGNGVAASVMDMSDGQTWLPNNDGSVVQVNPATGQPELRLIFGEEGEQLEVAQADGYLVVTNVDTGVMTPFDLAGLAAGASRYVGEDSKQLIGGGLFVVAELSPGFVQVVDPVTGASRSTAYRAGEDLADVVIDREGSIWMMTESGTLRELDLVEESGELTVSTDRPVAGAGPDTRLVPHAAGVTVFAPDGGAILQIGAGPDQVVQVPALQGSVLAAPIAPASLAPASATDVGLVFMLTDADLVTVDVGGLGCERPLTPAVFEDKVYVPCGGEGTVMVLDSRGNRAADDIVVPGGGDAKLLVDDGRLFVRSDDDQRIVMVQQDGSTQVTDTSGTEIPTVEPEVDDPLPPVSVPTTTPPVVGPTTPPVVIDPPVTQNPTQNPSQPPNGNDPDDDPTRPDDPDGPTESPTDDPTDGPSTPSGPGDGTEPGDADRVPRDVRARVQPDDSVVLSWTAPVERPVEYIVTSSDGAVEQTVPVTRTSLTITTLVCGSQLTLTVNAHHLDGRFASASTRVTTPDCVDPPAAADLTPSDVVATRDGDDVVVTWTAPVIRPDRFVVEGMDETETVAADATSVTFTDLACGTLAFEVTAVHPDAGTHTASSTAVAEDCTTDPADLEPRNVRLNKGAGNSFRLTWGEPVVVPESYRVTGPGVDESVPAGTTRWNGTFPCSTAIVQMTVTAIHDDGTESAVTSGTVSQTCVTTPPPTTTLTAPTNVQASMVDEDTVRVTWSASSPAAQEYVIIPSSGGTTSAGTALSADVDVTPGATYTFQVRASYDDQQATSAASNAVSMPAPATAPDAPTNATATHVSGGNGSSELVVNLGWTPGDDGGAPISQYDIWWGTGSGTGSGTLSGPGQVTIQCSGWTICSSGGNIDFTITPRNSVGQGGTAHVRLTVTGTPQPQNGDAVLSTSETIEDERTFVGTITYEPTTAWASAGGTCTAIVDGGAPESFDCATSSVVGSFRGARHVGMDGSVEVTITWPGGTATSSANVSMAGEGYCYYDRGTRHCVEAASVDPGEVDIDPLPWTPPEVPNPPVVVAGVGMLLGAGTLRTLRELRRRGLIESPVTTTTEHERAR